MSVGWLEGGSGARGAYLDSSMIRRTPRACVCLGSMATPATCTVRMSSTCTRPSWSPAGPPPPHPGEVRMAHTPRYAHLCASVRLCARVCVPRKHVSAVRAQVSVRAATGSLSEPAARFCRVSHRKTYSSCPRGRRRQCTEREREGERDAHIHRHRHTHKGCLPIRLRRTRGRLTGSSRRR
jgi:hypothetical protein